ncbi:monovalent cation/H+ antiporter complex subunit F [Kitasatospora sp. NPDC057965]|uniref:monovalent cation/H+ antiporter complex subunit F n=1 Tax=Kitasatospora sp. NPDC057965 TaxID=3346291 RepID=UPI0036DEA4E5
MNAWLTAAVVLAVGGITPGLMLGLRGDMPRRLAGLNLAGTATSVALLLLSQGFNRPSYADLALDLAVLAPAGTLVFTRFLAGEER